MNFREFVISEEDDYKEEPEMQEPLNDMEIANEIIKTIQENPYPEDSVIHALADQIGVEADEVERVAYALLTTFFAGGKSFNKEVEASGEEVNKGIEVEYEHVDTNSPFAKLISNKIRKDHHVESEEYYEYLEDMESKMKK